jgi:hypothetical protein
LLHSKNVGSAGETPPATEAIAAMDDFTASLGGFNTNLTTGNIEMSMDFDFENAPSDVTTKQSSSTLAEDATASFDAFLDSM